MRESHWIEWTRTRLQPEEREALLAALTSEQGAHLLEHHYVWAEEVGVLWNPPDGDPLRRARFTHGSHFQTQRGEFYIDSQGSACEISDHDSSRPRQAEAPAGGPSHEGETVARPNRREAHRGRGEDQGGLIIPDTAKEKPMEGRIVAAGKGKVDEDGNLRPLDVHEGDRVLFSKYSGTEIQLNGDEHLIIREDDVLAVLE
jgi:chaperonin GroES